MQRREQAEGLMSAENWYLQVVREGRVDPAYEANTSRYVHEVLIECFKWPFEQIVPQPSKRGFIDYRLEFPKTDVYIHVEVKPFRARLDDAMIRKYIVRPGKPTAEFHVGALTNLSAWHIFVAGPKVREVAGDPIACVFAGKIETRADIEAVEALIGYRSDGALRGIRAALGESWEVLSFCLAWDADVHGAVRRALREIRERHDLNVAVPQVDVTSSAVEKLLAGGTLPSTFPFTLAKLRQAVCSSAVAEVANEVLMRRFGSRSRAARIRDTIWTVTRVADEARRVLQEA